MKARIFCTMLIGMSAPLLAEEVEECHFQFIRSAQKLEIAEHVIPDEYTIERQTGESVTFQTGQNARSAFLIQQILNVVDFDTGLHADWESLSVTTVRDVIAIHGGEADLAGGGAAQRFYKQMLLSFMRLGAGEYVANSYTCDQYYSQAELDVYWDEFSLNFANGVVSDLNYSAQYAPYFANILVALFPQYPLSEVLVVEIDTTLKLAEAAELATEAAELATEAAELATEAAANLARAAELDAATLALRELNETLSGAAQVED